jgi:D-glycero-D-manno-heptose 1,7-bisphosphate phosphatase
MKGIVFLDRDGTLIEDSGYLSDPGKLREIPGASESLKLLSDAGMALAVVSNQAGLAKGKFSEVQMESVHMAFVAHFRERGVEFDAVEYCPHHPEGIVERYRRACDCRKPSPGMALNIIQRLGAPASCRMWVVGDKMTDVMMGKRINAVTILVATGYGKREHGECERLGESPGIYLPGMREAAGWILSGGKTW